MVPFDLNRIYLSSEGWDLLNDALREHERLRWELEYLAKKTQYNGNTDITDKLNLVKAQILLFERLMIGKRIDSLAVLVRHYAEILSQPRVEIRKVIS